MELICIPITEFLGAYPKSEGRETLDYWWGPKTMTCDPPYRWHPLHYSWDLKPETREITGVALDMLSYLRPGTFYR